jgi:hypothetical protein
MLSSAVVANVWKDVKEWARRRSVWPPEMRRVRKGKVGACEGGEVRKGVRACACCVFH